MENLHIFSGNSSSIVGSYFGKIFAENYGLRNRKNQIHEIESRNNLDSNVKSIAILDSYFENVKLNYDNLCDKNSHIYDPSVRSKPSKESNVDISPTEDVINKINMKSIWDGDIDIFEQFNINFHSSLKSAYYYLKNTIGKKNVKLLKIGNSGSEIINSKGIPGNCYNTLNLEDNNNYFQVEDILESVRHQLENSDLIKAFYFTIQADSIYGDVSKLIMDYLQDETPTSHKPSIMLLSNENYSILSDVLNFSVAKCLVDHSKSSDDIWLMNIFNIKNITNDYSHIYLHDPYSLCALALDQIVNIYNSYCHYNIQSSAFYKHVNHPFRNIASIINHCDGNQLNIKNFDCDNSIESICKHHFIDFCQTGFSELNLLDKNSILSLISGKEIEFEQGKNRNKILESLIQYTKYFFDENKTYFYGKKYEISSILHPICNVDNCHLLNNILETSVECKKNNRSINVIKSYFRLEDEEITSVIEDILSWKDKA